MDEHPGSQRIPLTLNKYLYGNADPVNHIDPSGNFSLLGVNISAANLNWAYTVSSIAFDLGAGNYAGASADIVQELVCTRFGRALCATAKRALGFFCNAIKCAKFAKKIVIGANANGVTLTKNLELSGIPKPAGSQAHHIVGGATKIGRKTRARLASFKIDVNSPSNGVFLPGCGESKAIGMIHCGKHTKEYEEAIADRLDHLTTREDILSELIEIRRELLSGAFEPLNMRAWR